MDGRVVEVRELERAKQRPVKEEIGARLDHPVKLPFVGSLRLNEHPPNNRIPLVLLPTPLHRVCFDL